MRFLLSNKRAFLPTFLFPFFIPDRLHQKHSKHNLHQHHHHNYTHSLSPFLTMPALRSVGFYSATAVVGVGVGGLATYYAMGNTSGRWAGERPELFPPQLAATPVTITVTKTVAAPPLLYGSACGTDASPTSTSSSSASSASSSQPQGSLPAALWPSWPLIRWLLMLWGIIGLGAAIQGLTLRRFRAKHAMPSDIEAMPRSGDHGSGWFSRLIPRSALPFVPRLRSSVPPPPARPVRAQRVIRAAHSRLSRSGLPVAFGKQAQTWNFEFQGSPTTASSLASANRFENTASGNNDQPTLEAIVARLGEQALESSGALSFPAPTEPEPSNASSETRLGEDAAAADASPDPTAATDDAVGTTGPVPSATTATEPSSDPVSAAADAPKSKLARKNHARRQREIEKRKAAKAEAAAQNAA